MSGAHRSEQDLPQGFLAPVQVYLVESLLRNLLPASLGCPGPSALGPGAAQTLPVQCCAGFCSQGSAVGCGLHLEEGQPHLSFSCMYSANAKVEFSISVWMGARPFSLQPSRGRAGDVSHHHLHLSRSFQREDTGAGRHHPLPTHWISLLLPC